MLGSKCLVWRGLATRLVYEKRKYKKYFMNEQRLKEHDVFFSKERFLVYPTSTNLTQKKEKNVLCKWFISTFTR